MIGSTLLLRQIHPSFVQAGFVTSQAFRPTPKDDAKLSVYDGDQITAEASFVHYTESLQLASVGTMGLAVEECTEEGLEVRPDPAPFPEHALIDFTGLSSGQCEKKGKKLKAKAEKRGWLHQGPEVT